LREAKHFIITKLYCHSQEHKNGLDIQQRIAESIFAHD